MRTLVTALCALCALVALTACGADGDVTATDEPSAVAPDSPTDATAPGAPVPSGTVRTRGLAMVMDDPARAGVELCLGPVAESYPPQCGGPSLADWDWDGLGRGMHETQGDIRWGSYAVTGTWDGTTFAASSAVPAALYDVAAPTPEPTSSATVHVSIGLEDVVDELGQLPFTLGTAVVEGRVLLDVIYDDDSLQAWADEVYGQGVVVVTSALVDVDG